MERNPNNTTVASPSNAAFHNIRDLKFTAASPRALIRYDIEAG
jgi:hypothetical protein